jgi:hypothetical protein
MPLVLKTLREAAAELGMPEVELKTMVDLKKVRAVLKRGQPLFAPDEIAKLKRLRKTVPESAKPVIAATPAPIPAKPAPTGKPSIPKRPPPSRRIGPKEP